MQIADSKKNLYFGILFQFLSLLMGFVIRKLLVDQIGLYMIGVNGTYENIISMLSLANFGISSASMFYLYQAFSHKDYELVVTYYQTFKKYYRYVALAIGVIGAFILWDIDLIINTEGGDIVALRVFFFVHLLRAIATYLITAPRLTLQCDEKRYYCQKADIVCMLVFGAIKAVCLIIFKSYIIYLLLSLIEMLCSNGYITYCFYKQYGHLDLRRPRDIKESDKNVISYGKHLAINQINYFINNCTDNIVLSKIFGTLTVGLMSNYYLIVDAVKGFTTQIFSSLEATIIKKINLSSGEKEDTEIYSETSLISYGIASFVGVMLYALTDLFVKIYFGEEYGMGSLIPLYMTISVVLNIFQNPSVYMLDAKGLNDKIVLYSTATMAVNIISSIILAYKVGPGGVLLGTIAANVVLLLGQDYAVWKYGLKKNVKVFLFKYLYLALIAIQFLLVSLIVPESGTFLTWILLAFKAFGIFVVFMLPFIKKVWTIIQSILR